MQEQKSPKEIIHHFLDNQILLSPDMKEHIINLKEELNNRLIQLGQDILYVNSDVLLSLANQVSSKIHWHEFEKAKAIFEKVGDKRAYLQFLKYLDREEKKIVEKLPDVKIISNFEEASSKREPGDFTRYFNARFEALQKILFARDELQSATSISRILAKRERENVSLIGMVKNKQTTKNGNTMVTIEDSTGEINVLVNKNKPEINDAAKDIVMDEVIGVSGVNGENIVFANNIVFPDIPTNELKRASEESYALFLSDIHVGSKNFLAEDFNRFISWINQKTGNEKQKEIASKVKYIFIIGDLVDGVGIYPGQEADLEIPDIYAQYEECTRLLSQIPNSINVIICAGNHDAMRIAEPQPCFSSEYCKSLTTIPNVIRVSNPGMVNIASTDKFSGFNVLMYHGYSFDHYVANVDSIRNNGGYDRADLIMKFLLKRRHLAPTHTSTLYVPTINRDPLVIDVLPDFFVTGHIHKSAAANYKNITLISGSCWQSKTAFQEKVGHHPEPSRVPLVNLATREVKILRFGK